MQVKTLLFFVYLDEFLVAGEEAEPTGTIASTETVSYRKFSRTSCFHLSSRPFPFHCHWRWIRRCFCSFRLLDAAPPLCPAPVPPRLKPLSLFLVPSLFLGIIGLRPSGESLSRPCVVFLPFCCLFFCCVSNLRFWQMFIDDRRNNEFFFSVQFGCNVLVL